MKPNGIVFIITNSFLMAVFLLITSVNVLATPVLFETQKLIAPDGVTGDAFGHVVDVEANTLLVGAPSDDFGHGAVYAYMRVGDSWLFQQKLIAPDGVTGDAFGGSVSLSGDTALISALGRNGNQGTAYVFTQTEGVWSLQQELTTPGGPSASFTGDFFGYAIALDNDTALISAVSYEMEEFSDLTGAAFLFARTEGVWSFQQILRPPEDTLGDSFGRSVALNGTTAFVGFHTCCDVGNGSGPVYVYTQMEGVWAQQDIVTLSDGTSVDLFNHSIALGDNTALIGNPIQINDDLDTSYIYSIVDGEWTLEQQLSATDWLPSSDFGFSVALGADVALVTAPYDALGGSAYVYVPMAGVWVETLKLKASDGNIGDDFGRGKRSVSLSGSTVVVGASESVYVFDLPTEDLPPLIAGFLKGHGWFDSPAGAYLTFPDLMGKVTFAITSGYLGDDATIEGRVLIDFDGISQTFRSTAIEWMGGAGDKIQLRGTGSIEEGSHYDFMLTVVDNKRGSKRKEKDMLRVQLWDAESGALMYDNAVDDSSGVAVHGNIRHHQRK